MSVIHICGGRSVVLRVADDCKPDRYCFLCRKRLPHRWALVGDPPDVESYYEPLPVLRCIGCGEDHTLGFGWYRDGPHYPEERLDWRDPDPITYYVVSERREEFMTWYADRPNVQARQVRERRDVGGHTLGPDDEVVYLSGDPRLLDELALRRRPDSAR